MHTSLLWIHSILRYLVIVFLVIVIINSLTGWFKNHGFTKKDDFFSLILFSLVHTQLLVGIILFFVSPLVEFGGETMKVSTMRYWTVEHGFIMIVAIILITIGRVSAKKIAEAKRKHRRLFIYNVSALAFILLGIWMSHRGFLSLPQLK